ncbi:MAG: SufD family Fe-S cluster assembly protein [Candidatus Micrarchaeota archaeon]|nr:SufD family Fe-S cluster assembly protein [Candidatus Micrarchaeota archaeon]
MALKKIKTASGADAQVHKFSSSKKQTLFLESKKGERRVIKVEDFAGAEVVIVNSAQAGEKNLFKIEVELGKNSSLKLLVCNFGRGETRSECTILQKGENSRCEHYEIALIGEETRLKVQSAHTHLASGTYSRSEFRYAAAGRAAIETVGEVVLSKAAKNSNARLTAKGMLLSRDASVKLSPQLRVQNKDVAAGHGAAVAPFSNEEMFYLGARGIEEREARSLVLLGFLQSACIAGKMEKTLLGKLSELLERKMGEIDGI